MLNRVCQEEIVCVRMRESDVGALGRGGSRVRV